MWLIGLVIGAFIGSKFGFGGTLLGGAVGSAIGILIAKINKSEQEFSLQLKRMNETIMRLGTRLDGLEKSQRGQVAVDNADTSTVPEQEPEPVTPALIVRTQNFPFAASSPPSPQAASAAQSHAAPINTAGQQQPIQSSPEPTLDLASLISSPLWQKLFGGNILAKVGVVLLFFGVASALKLAADYGMFPVSVRLLLAAVASVAMILFGWSRATGEKHRMFGFALQGGRLRNTLSDCVFHAGALPDDRAATGVRAVHTAGRELFADRG